MSADPLADACASALGQLIAPPPGGWEPREPCRLAVVGSRDYPSPELVRARVLALPARTVVVSGGAEGVDTWAAEAAAARGLSVEVLLPELDGIRSRGEASRRYHERNARVIAAVDRVLAFTDKDSGGTWDTIKRARAAGLPVEVVRSSLAKVERAPHLGRGFLGDLSSGPYHVRRAGLGTVCLQQRRYLTADGWAALVEAKDRRDPALVEELAQALRDALVALEPEIGRFDATACPAERLDRREPGLMPFVLAKVCALGGPPPVALFAPRVCEGRGAHARRDLPEFRPGGREALPARLLLLDDVSTTGRTIREHLALVHAAGAVARAVVGVSW
jgi:hypothetical protein